MKVSYPLSLKISLWLLLNLLLLVVAGGVIYWVQFGRGWDSLTAGALGERMQSIGDTIMTDLRSADEDQRDRLLARAGEQAGVGLYLFRNDGVQLLGTKIELPAPLRDDITRLPLRGGPPPEFLREEGHRRGRSDELRPPGRRGPFGAGRPIAVGRMVHRDRVAAETWLGLRVPFYRDDGPPTPCTLVIRATSVLGLIRFLDLVPWLALFAGMLALSVVFWLPMVAGITHALRQLTHATDSIAEGKFDTRVATRRRDELGHLGHSVNRMAERLDTLVHGQKRFLGDVAHELGSPLGRLQVATEILQERAEPSLQQHVTDVREEVQQMASLVNELLAFTKAGLRAREANLTDVELAPLVAEVLEREGATSRVQTPIEPGLRVQADPELLARALANLVRNARRYAGPEALIAINARRDASQVLLRVEDDGPGVPAEALSRLGEPFYRPEFARTRETGGVGLGLAIVRSAVSACGGEVRFANRAPHGFSAELRLKASA